MVSILKQLKQQIQHYQAKNLPCSEGEPKMVEDLIWMKNQAIAKIRGKCIHQAEIEEVIDIFTQKDFNQQILMRIVDENEDMCMRHNSASLAKIIERLKQSKHFNMDQMDIGTEFTHLFQE